MSSDTADTANSEAQDGRLSLDIKVESPSACERQITVTVPREDIDRYFSKAIDELVPQAEVPGFRPGRAPRQLVENRFKDQVSNQVKGNLLMDSMTQVNEDQSFSAISEPDFDYDAVELPDEGPLSFEFSLEVRPEFDVPVWQGLSVNRPTREFSEEDIDHHLNNLLARHGQLVPTEEAAARDDYVVVNISFQKDGEEVSRCEEESIRVRPILSFVDAKLEKFDELMIGAKADDKKSAELEISADAENEELRGASIQAEFEVLEVKQLETPKLTQQLLDRLGGFTNKEELRDAIKDELERQLKYHQSKSIRNQITKSLTDSANWELPNKLLQRQSGRELERAVMELQASGFSNDEIQAHANQIRQNSMLSTNRALKEHFILERIAEEEGIEASEQDYQQEIMLIASQRHESPRRVRSRLEKRGQMDSLRNQIVERRVIELIMSRAVFNETKYEPEALETTAVEFAIGSSSEEAIPEAQPDSNPQPLPQPEDHS